ncbi:hypothetical protein ONE63_002373 [Megalurothrips usitatus]|uniref:C-mannosyltransferase DPY19L1 n=1 Tax=Megalurothrips usitatus TaxID=439358 RepID=A0AAV7X804_9NEOP|nr:hypothetical protein ONE63_002373 [Megalurothrips usitatus]
MSLRRSKLSAAQKCTDSNKNTPIVGEKHGFSYDQKDDSVNAMASKCVETRRFTMLVLGFLAGILHYYHVSVLYENDRHFSHLSSLEREMCFRSEMGLYYSFYKRIIYSQSFLEGLHSLKSDNLTEYPSTINSLSKFNIYPEVMIAGLYRTYQYFLQAFNSTGRTCYTVNRGGGWPPVESCIGLGDPILFYLEVVWIFAGITALLLFCLGTQLSGSLIGGLVTVTSFFTNHTESTRVQWTPPLRESFAYPMIVLHLLTITSILHNKKNIQGAGYKFQEGIIAFSTLVSLLFWQFSQFILACEIAILIVTYSIGIIKRNIFQKVFTCILTGYLAALLVLIGNHLLMLSFLTAILLSSWALLLYDRKLTQMDFSWGSIFRIAVAFSLTVGLKFSFPATGNDSHILKMFMSKIFESSNDFHTLMYICAPEFQSLPWSYVVAITKTLLLPLLAIILFILLFQQVRHLYLLQNSLKRAKCAHTFIILEPAHVFNICLLVAFLALALMAMRLKLFLTPQICVLVSLLASKQVLKVIPLMGGKHTHAQNMFLLAILVTLCFCGRDNIQSQHAVEGEYSNYPLEEILTWIKMKSNRHDVFAGPMPVMASVLLSTGRPIVNHPYYEDQEMRARTVQAYSVFSRKNSFEVFKAIQGLGANYVILEANKCFDQLQPRNGCKMTDLWDVEDPVNYRRPALCPQLFSGDASPFTRLFSNSEYAILYLTPNQQD